MNRVINSLDGFFGGAKKRLLVELERNFPGVTAESLKRGWIPVPQSVLEQQLRRDTQGLRGVKEISMKCVPGSFHLRAETDRLLLKHRTRLILKCEQFELGQQARLAVFACDAPIAVEGRNFLGRVSAWLARAIVLNALKTGTVGKQVIAMSEGVLQLDWPKMTVHLDKIDLIERVLARRLWRYTLLDFLSFGPLRIEDKHVQIKIGMKGQSLVEGALEHFGKGE